MKPLAPANPSLPNSAGELKPPPLRIVTLKDGTKIDCSTWRVRLQQVLWPVWPKLAQLPISKRRHYLRELYPYSRPWKGGPSWQYKVWCDEIARLEGRKLPLGTRTKAPDPPDPRQQLLFPTATSRP